MPEQGHVFISYSRRDGSEYAKTLYQTFHDLGRAAWYDRRSLSPIQDFSVEIEKAIESSSHVLVCLTPSIVERPDSFVRREILYAQGWKKPIIPLVFPEFDTRRVPIMIKHLTWLKVTDVDTDFPDILARTSQDDDAFQPPISDDPFYDYLQRFYREVVNKLDRLIIRPIDLDVEHTVDAVPHYERQTNILDLIVSPHDDPSPNAPPEFRSFAEAFDHYDGQVLLLGQPGAGKTITLLMHTREAIAARLEDASKPLPLFHIIPTWDSDNPPPWADWLASAQPDLKANGIRQVIERGEALLLLDGLDELGSERPVNPQDPRGETYNPRKRFINALSDVCDNRILVTCRIGDYQAIGEQIPLNGAVTLQPMTDAQIAEYLEEQPELWALIQSDAQLRKIMETPLLLSFFGFAYRDMTEAEKAKLADLKQAGDLRDRIFLAYIEKRYRHEEQKLEHSGEKLPYSLGETLAILGKLAMRNAAFWGQENVLPTASDPLGNISTMFNGIIETSNILRFTELAVQLDTLAQGLDDEYGYPTFRFVHLMLRDTLAYANSITALKDGDQLGRIGAVQALGNISDARAVTQLCAVLNDGDVLVRQYAVLALGQIGDFRAVVPLSTALNDMDGYVRYHAFQVLGDIGDPRAVPVLIAAINDCDYSVRRSAAEALGKIGDPRAVPALTAALRDKHMSVRNSAVSALGEIGDPNAVAPLSNTLNDEDRGIRSNAAEALGKIGAPAVAPLIVALKDGDQWVRATAAEALGNISDSRAVSPLIAAINDWDYSVRRSASKALGQIGAPAVAPLIVVLREADKNPRRSATEALGKIGAPAVAPLIAALIDEHVDVRRVAAQALSQIGDVRAVVPLCTALKDWDRFVRSFAADALGQIGDPRAVNPLIAALNDEDMWIREAAADALGQIGDPRAVNPLCTALNDGENAVRIKATKALGKIGDPRAVAPLSATLNNNDGDWWRRGEATAEALGKIGKPAVPPLIVALNDLDRGVRYRAAQTLGEIGDPRAVNPLIAALNDEDMWIRRNAADALGEIGDPRAVNPLCTALNDGDWWIREAAAEALGKIGDPRAINPLCTALKDKHLKVHIRAKFALKEIRTAEALAAVIAWYKEQDEGKK